MTATNSVTELPLMGDAVSYQSFKAKVLVNLVVTDFMVPVIRLQAYSSSITRKCFLFVPRYVTALRRRRNRDLFQQLISAACLSSSLTSCKLKCEGFVLVPSSYGANGLLTL